VANWEEWCDYMPLHKKGYRTIALVTCKQNSASYQIPNEPTEFMPGKETNPEESRAKTCRKI